MISAAPAQIITAVQALLMQIPINRITQRAMAMLPISSATLWRRARMQRALQALRSGPWLSFGSIAAGDAAGDEAFGDIAPER
jgi:hypothetical protein